MMDFCEIVNDTPEMREGDKWLFNISQQQTAPAPSEDGDEHV